MKYLTEQQQEAQLRLFKSYLNKDALIIGSKVLTIEDDLKQGIIYYTATWSILFATGQVIDKRQI